MRKATAKFPASLLLLLLAGCGQPQGSAVRNAPAEVPHSEASAAPPAEAPADVSACRLQDGKRIADNGIHAIGTEPFWAADVEGRCVTYSTPQNQAGTRVWAAFSGRAENGSWSGALNGSTFEMHTTPRPGCSDGMSDKRYPIAVTLLVNGEQRRGCAEPRGREPPGR
jgi:uncharacterized membrane protein